MTDDVDEPVPDTAEPVDTDDVVEKVLTPEGLSQLYITPGMEGMSHVNARQLVVIQKLADRSENTSQERMLLLDSDMREAMAHARAKLDAAAQKYAVSGFTWDLDNIGYEHAGPSRTITATLRLARDGS